MPGIDRHFHRGIPWLFAIALLLYLHPYTGIRHDAPLYLVQALYLLYPSIYAHDFFFVAGNQGDYTLFPRLIAALIAHFNPGTVFLWLSLVGRVLFFAASWLLIRAIFPKAWRMPALLAVLAMPARYGAFGIFAYAEPFLTSRPYAEGLVLVALACTVRGRLIPAAIAIVLAAVLHPLQALPGAIVAWCWLAAREKRWFWCLLAVVPVMVLGWAGVKPLNQLYQVMDADWLEIINTYSGHIFLQNWRPIDWCVALTDAYLLHVASTTAASNDNRLAELTRAILHATLVGLAATVVLADLSRLVLPTGLQPWRVLWCAHWLAMASIPWLLVQALREEGRLSALLLASIAILGASLPGSSAVLLVLALIPLHMFLQYRRTSIQLRARRLIAAALVAILVVSLLRYFLGGWESFRLYGSTLALMRVDVVLLSYPLVLGLLAAALWWLHQRASRVGTILLLGLGIAAVAGSTIAWDTRSPWTRTFERHADEVDVFGTSIPESAQVYWYSVEKLPLGAWMTLNRASYFSVFQMSGQMFNRETSITGIKRNLQISQAETSIAECEWKQTAKVPREACEVPSSALSVLCTPYGDLSPPDFFVMPIRQKRGVIGQWKVHDQSGHPLTTLYLYRCTDFADKPTGEKP
ncbi:hypothetical protein SAMN05428989_2335 [Pseudoxanthomonas sp. GM95]|uniref:hypothetical protein n=1 Tax=Pseudoxanthomonas sp. GM95 TaxID=1881043 RepID=UPI0008CB31E8|nr:hypothetical protein [Pseudoxanthomonas sp. GM95]SEL72124.1 hypothetical protein SAMN05428989_2335 [Pseudoxanthomonas sp. GM95]